MDYLSFHRRSFLVFVATTMTMIVHVASQAQTIRTPPAPATPQVNGPAVFGVRPGTPFVYKIPATGNGTITYSVTGLPAGLSVDPTTGMITGTISNSNVANYTVTLNAASSLGTNSKPFTIEVGNTIGLTPAMGWNSWNVWGPSVTAAKVEAAASALVSTGLINYGWSYVNTDDYWQGARATASNPATNTIQGAIQGNSTFLGAVPNMQSMFDDIHSLGLKAGIYSTPWIQSYGGNTGGSANNSAGTFIPVNGTSQEVDGSISFAQTDAEQWAAWGVDYVKYDWNPLTPNPVSNATFTSQTSTMASALQSVNRDIIFSYSNAMPFNQIATQQPMLNSWRISGDITDTWTSVSSICFGQNQWAPYSGPGHFNDMDMLEVGVVGKDADPQPTALTPDEQYTQITMWSLASAPLLLGCDLTKLDAFTLNLLTNPEVIAVDQDPLGKMALEVSNVTLANGDELEVYSKPMADGSLAVGLFNLGANSETVTVNWSDLGISGNYDVRDLWREVDKGDFNGEYQMTVASHSAELVDISAIPEPATFGLICVGLIVVSRGIRPVSVRYAQPHTAGRRSFDIQPRPKLFKGDAVGREREVLMKYTYYNAPNCTQIEN